MSVLLVQGIVIIAASFQGGNFVKNYFLSSLKGSIVKKKKKKERKMLPFKLGLI